jgi:hypothetical protein
MVTDQDTYFDNWSTSSITNKKEEHKYQWVCEDWNYEQFDI